MKNARAKRAKMLFFIVKYANLWGFCCRLRRGCLSSLLLLCVVIAEKVVKFVLQSLTQPAKQQRDSQACNSKFFIFSLI